jgi:hypothetical protein
MNGSSLWKFSDEEKFNRVFHEKRNSKIVLKKKKEKNSKSL